MEFSQVTKNILSVQYSLAKDGHYFRTNHQILCQQQEYCIFYGP